MTTKQNSTFHIDEALATLEEINAKLSASDVTLEEALKLYSEGCALAQECRSYLEGVEKKLEVVNADQ